MNYHYSFTTKNKLKSRENMCKSHDGNAKKGKSILKYNQDKKDFIHYLCRYKITASKNSCMR